MSLLSALEKNTLDRENSCMEGNFLDGGKTGSLCAIRKVNFADLD
jgi:hypothetical protein